MKVNVVTPWYPDYASQYSGVFVRQQVSALRSLGTSVAVEVPALFPAPPGPTPQSVATAMRDLAAGDVDALFATEDSVTWIPTPVPSRSGFAGRVTAFVESISLKREFRPVDADLHHAHLGVPTGAALASLGDRPLLVTEHQSTLDRIFSEPDARLAYREAIEAADRFFCVSTHLRSKIRTALGSEAADRVGIMPNIVDLEAIPFTARDAHSFRNWIYVGTVAAHKGIETLLRTFNAFLRLHSGSATLTIVGDGPHLPWVRKFLSINGLHPSVSLSGPKPHSEIGSLLGDADVMVHLSPSETFGIASLEGIGAGIPVVSLLNGGAQSAWGEIESQSGLLLPLDLTPEDIAGEIADLARDPSRLDLGFARTWIEANYAPEVIARRLLAEYEGMLA